MPQDAKCPKCKHLFPVTEARQAFTVACPKCDADMTVEFKKPATPPDAGQPPYDLLVKAGAMPGANAALKAPKKKIDDDDDEPKRGGGSAAIVLLSGGMGLLFVLGGLGLTGWFLFTQIDTTETASSWSNNRPNNNKPNNNNNPGNRPNNPGNKPNNNSGGGDPFTPAPVVREFDLRPVNGPVPAIGVSDVPDGTPVGLPGKAGAVAVGGGGRYIVMHFPDAKQLAVFDVSTGEPTFADADSGDVRLAAGLSRVVLHAAGANIMRVFTLPDLKKQYDSSVPVNGLKAIAMGSRTNGPLVGIGTFGDPHLLELSGAGIREVQEARKEGLGLHWNMLRAAPDGTAFATFDGFRPNHKTTVLSVENRQWKSLKDINQVPFFGTDGNLYGNGIVTDARNIDQRFGGVGAGSGTWFVPAASGNGTHFLKVAPTNVGIGAKKKMTLTVSVHSNRNSEQPASGTEPFVGLAEFDNLVDRSGNFPAVAYDQHLFLIPEAKLLVTLTAARDKLVLRKVDLR